MGLQMDEAMSDQPILNGRWKLYKPGVWVIELLDNQSAEHGQIVSVIRRDKQVCLKMLSEQVPNMPGWWYVDDIDDLRQNDWQTAEYDWPDEEVES